MSTINDGGPVFPHSFVVQPGNIDPFSQQKVDTPTEHIFPGMYLRDRFAIAGIEPGILELREKGDLGPKQLATFCYRFADAMLAARQKGGA